MNYERGLNTLESRIPASEPDDRGDFLSLKQRLTENQREERRYGSTETTRAERTRIISGLTELALKYAGMSFLDLNEGKLLSTPPHGGTQQQIQQQSIHVTIHQGSIQTSDDRARATPGASAGGSGDHWNNETLRELLSDAFSDEQIRMLCFDHFRPVYEQLSTGMTKSDTILRLVDHCLRTRQVEKLLEHVQARNPRMYAHYAARSGG